jgi:hypothetical protein
MMGEQYGIKLTFSRLEMASIPWSVIKRRMDIKVFDEFFAPLVGDGIYHVIRSQYRREERLEIDATEYYLVIDHALANVQQITIAEMVEIPKKAVPVCSACGNVLFLDKRGGCKACGHPAGEDWNK